MSTQTEYMQQLQTKLTIKMWTALNCFLFINGMFNIRWLAACNGYDRRIKFLLQHVMFLQGPLCKHSLVEINPLFLLFIGIVKGVLSSHRTVDWSSFNWSTEWKGLLFIGYRIDRSISLLKGEIRILWSFLTLDPRIE